MNNVIIFTLLIFLAGCYEEAHVHEAVPPIINYPAPNNPIPPIRPPVIPGFVGLDLIEDTILLDLQTLDSNQDRLAARYILGCDQSNSGKSLEELEKGLNIGFNRLSNEAFLNPVRSIGSSNCIFRIDLDDYTITRGEWRAIERSTAFDFVTNTVRGQNLQFLTQARKPYIWAFELCAMYECDEVTDQGGLLYYDLVDQDIDTNVFLAQQGINLQDEVDGESVIYSGFSQSQIALGKTRLVLAVESDSGYCLATYDSILGGDDLFENPFSIELIKAGGRINSNKLFDFDAQEWICSLNNRMFGLWRLNNANNLAEVEAPTNIVIHVGSRRIDAAIRTGSCHECHFRQVAIPFKDQIADHIRANSAFDEFEKALGSIFFNYNRMSAVIEDINRRNDQALAELGIDTSTSVDPLTENIFNPYRNEMNAEQVAGLVLMPEDEFLSRLAGTSISSQRLGNLVNGGTVSLAVLSANFNILTLELRAFEDDNL